MLQILKTFIHLSAWMRHGPLFVTFFNGVSTSMHLLFKRRLRADYVFGWLQMSKKRWISGMVCSGKPTELIKITNGLLRNGNATEYLALLKNVRADTTEIFLKIVLTLQINLGSHQETLSTKLPSEQGSAFLINGSKSTDQSSYGKSVNFSNCERIRYS